ncbi:MAG: hypothetical protein NC489_47000 [Ruminococcus flavefaciens]|nr:hypothetical protein [Ruminococcus flavefaciens]
MSKTKSWNKITLEDILRLDSFDQQIYIHDSKSNKSEPMLPTNRAFFTQVYTDTSHNEIGMLDGSHQVHRVISIEDWLYEIDQTENSLVILIEGYAGCGKSTFVQYVLSKQLGTYNYDYSYYNYDIGAYYDNKKSHRIVAAIRECFVKQLRNHITDGKIQIINKFEELLSQEEIKYLDFTYEIYNIFLDPDTDTFHKSIKNLLEKNDVNNFRITMNKMLNKFSCEQIMALDCLVRIAAYIESNDHSDSLLYICYDNMDSIENYNELNSNFPHQIRV